MRVCSWDPSVPILPAKKPGWLSWVWFNWAAAAWVGSEGKLPRPTASATI